MKVSVKVLLTNRPHIHLSRVFSVFVVAVSFVFCFVFHLCRREAGDSDVTPLSGISIRAVTLIPLFYNSSLVLLPYSPFAL